MGKVTINTAAQHELSVDDILADEYSLVKAVDALVPNSSSGPWVNPALEHIAISHTYLAAPAKTQKKVDLAVLTTYANFVALNTATPVAATFATMSLTSMRQQFSELMACMYGCQTLDQIPPGMSIVDAYHKGILTNASFKIPLGINEYSLNTPFTPKAYGPNYLAYHLYDISKGPVEAHTPIVTMLAVEHYLAIGGTL